MCIHVSSKPKKGSFIICLSHIFDIPEHILLIRQHTLICKEYTLLFEHLDLPVAFASFLAFRPPFTIESAKLEV